MREKADFRDNLVRLDEKFPGRELLRISEVAEFMGVDRRTVQRRYTFDRCYITKTRLAKEMS